MLPNGKEPLRKATLVLVCAAAFATTHAQDKPNFLFILTDDLAYGDLSCHGNTIIQTPNLDNLAESAVEMTNFYVAPICAPTRAALLTGRNHLLTGVWGVHAGNEYVNPDETMFSEVLNNAGYRTAFFGKWHSGSTEGYAAYHQGFEESWEAKLYDYYDNKFKHQGEWTQTEGWTSQVLTDKAIAYMTEHRDEDFLVYLPFLTPHKELLGSDTPNKDTGPDYNAPAEYVAPYLGRGYSEGFEALAGMISFMDYNVGRLLDALDDLGLAEETIVFFASDNGPTSGGLADGEMDLRNPLGLAGEKSRIMENGIRVPFFVKYGSKMTPRKINDPAHVVDIYPTLLDFAGVTNTGAKPLSGISLKSVLMDGTAMPDRYIRLSESYCKINNVVIKETVPPGMNGLTEKNFTLGIRHGNYKLTKWYQGEDYALYDISVDPREQNDIRSSNSTVFAELHAKANEWLQEIVSSSDVFTPVTYYIGLNHSEDTPYTKFGPTGCGAIGGNTEVRPTYVSNFTSVGDYAQWPIKVAKSGNYRLELRFTSENLTGGRIKVTLGGQTFEAAVTEANLSQQNSFGLYQEFGTFALVEGLTSLKIEVSGLGSGSGMIIDDLKEIFAYPTTGIATAPPGPFSVKELCAPQADGHEFLRAGPLCLVRVTQQGEHRVDLIGVNGKIVETVSGNSPTEHILKTASLSAGMYVVKVTIGNTVTRYRLPLGE